ncbi:two-component system sensor histidine kinase YesM [Bacillus mesophilus]|uniref:histidine kinase n=1 Tax=Bacillus mesophilus TaxID=1808955 RepID=A0A6M0QB25_9BACI|nr:sensor histidine kinase [Bacillus mesophilus]MBM7662923.1 two-component system sensor histidine kinase YesM [Bacillus mesophilus]NEY73512.1 sensor histidine kinase [Bacillus mesophilus]
MQKKLISLYVIIFMIPAIIFTLYYSNQLYENSLSAITKKNENLLEMERIHIHTNIESMRRTAQMVVSDNDFIEYIKTRDETNINELIDFKMNAFSNVAKLQNNNPTIAHIRLFTSNPYVTEMWPIVFKEDRIIDKPWLSEVMVRNGMELWSYEKSDLDLLDRYLIINKNAKISLLREIEYPKDEHLGVIEISMHLKNFYPNMYSPVNDGQSEMIVIDSHQNVYQDPNKSFLNEHEIELSVIQKEHNTIKNKEIASAQFTQNNIPYLIVSTYIEDIESHVINVISLENIYAEMKQTRNIALSGTFLIVFILSLLTYLLISFLLKRLYKLIELMKRVEAGDFAVQVDIYGQSEIAQLAHHFREMLKKINRLIADAVNKQASTKEAELRALKTQIDAHFLYNTLENIKMMAEIEEKYEISDALTSLGEMMRYNLKWKNDFVVLQEEVTHIKNYIDIMNLRLDKRISLKVKIPGHLLEQEILKMSLQPIVENSLRHGIIHTIYDGMIEITACIKDDNVQIQVTDNGVGMTAVDLEKLNHHIQVDDEKVPESIHQQGGIGLRNVNERIKLHYGNEYGLHVDSLEGQYTKVVVTLPCIVIKGVRKHV